MPAIVSLPPKLLDHSFPRIPGDLEEVEEALGVIADKAIKREVLIFGPEVFRMIVQDFHWGSGVSSRRMQIYNLLALLFLSGQEFLVTVNCDSINDGSHHPLPLGLPAAGGNIDIWRAEMAAALRWHDGFLPDAYYIGVACSGAFSGKELGSYPANTSGRRFPIVGPNNLHGESATLKDAVIYCLPAGMSAPSVSFREAKRNLRLLGAIEISNPKRGSHFHVTFPHSRSWSLDPNDNPIPVRYLKELEEITGHEYPVICFVLTQGEFPPSKRFYEP